MFADSKPGSLSKDEIYRDGLPWRRVDYKDDDNARDVSYRLRLFWNLQPPPPQYGDSYTLWDVVDLLGQFMKTPPAEPKDFGWKRDKDNWPTDWRKAIAQSYCNIFSDITSFLYGVNCRTGHWHCREESSLEFLRAHGSGYSTFQVSYPPAFVGENKVLSKSFSSDIFAVPMFVDTGLTFSVDSTNPTDGEKRVQVWDDSLYNTKALFLRSEVEVSISLAVDSGDTISRGGHCRNVCLRNTVQETS